MEKTEKSGSVSGRKIPPNFLPNLIAILLYIAAGLKLAEFLQGGVRSNPHFYLAEILFELILASALLSGFARSLTIRFTGLVFLVFLGVTIDRALHGRHSCGCFGPVKVNPWITSLLDTSIIISILIYVKMPYVRAPIRQGMTSFAVLLTVVLIGTGVAMNYFRPAHLLANGRLIGGHGPIVCNPPSWYGKKLPLMRFIKAAGPLHSGKWLIVMYYHQCPDCQAEIRLIERHLQRRVEKRRPLPDVALVQIPPFGRLPKNVPTQHMHMFQMKSARHWLPPFLPVLIGIQNGVVTRVGTRVPGQWFGFSTPPLTTHAKLSSRPASPATHRKPAPAKSGRSDQAPFAKSRLPLRFDRRDRAT